MTKTGRPTKFTQAIADEICERLSKGEPLAVMCREDHLPCVTTVWTWSNNSKELSDAIAQARVEGFDAIAADTLEIADNGSNDWMLANDGDNAGYRANGEAVARSRLRVDTRLKLLSKWDPKRYGDKMDVTLDGKVEIDRMTDEELNARIAALAAKSGLK